MAASEQDITKAQKPIPPSDSALTQEDVQEFQRLVREETGVEIGGQEAWDRAIELIALVRMLIRPDPEDAAGT